jgi:hypothetical protein
MRTIQLNPAATELISAWYAAKDAEIKWAEHRRNIEEQILSLHPSALQDLETLMGYNNTLSVSATLGSLKVEAKRTVDLDQAQVGQIVADHPDLLGPLFRVKYEVAASRSLFGALSGGGEVAEAVRGAVKFRAQKPYFSAGK